MYYTHMTADVSATDLARNLGDVLAKVRYRGQTFLVRKNGKVIARIEPATDQDGPSAKEAFAAWVGAAAPDPGFADDLERVGRADVPGKNPWDS
jgi:prevent-host-death family protein